MAQKVIVIINAEPGQDLLPEEIQNHLNELGYNVELSEDTLQKNTFGFQPLAYALQDDVSIALGNQDYESTDKLIDIASRRLSGSEELQNYIAEEAENAVSEGFDDEDLEEDEDEIEDDD